MGNVAQMWRAGFGLGLRVLRCQPVLGLKRLMLPVGYWRAAEFAYVWRQLPYPAGARISNLGSPKELAHFLPRRKGYELVATDILPEAITLSRRYALAQDLDGEGSGKV